METPQRAVKSLWLVVIVAALAASVLGFMSSYHDEQARFLEMSSIAESHLLYALQLKDDMALIDWSKSLERLPSLSAFQALSNSKVIAEGGNKQLCPAVISDGISFQFPYCWTVHSTFHKDPAAPLTLTLVFKDLKEPLWGGIFPFLVCGGLGWILINLSGLSSKRLLPPEPTASSKKETQVLKPILSMADNDSFTLVMDKDYMICQVTPLAAKALGRQVSDLVENHFLDLLPDPAVMKAIAEAKEIKLSNPFPSHPELSALIRPLPEGTILIFEIKTGSEKA